MRPPKLQSVGKAEIESVARSYFALPTQMELAIKWQISTRRVQQLFKAVWLELLRENETNKNVPRGASIGDNGLPPGV